MVHLRRRVAQLEAELRKQQMLSSEQCLVQRFELQTFFNAKK